MGFVMKYVNTFILQNEVSFFFNKLAFFLASKKIIDYSFEMIYSNERIEKDDFDDFFISKYNGVNHYIDVLDDNVACFPIHLINDSEFVGDISSYILSKGGFLILHIFSGVDDLSRLYESGFNKTRRNNAFRLEVYNMDWEEIKLPDPNIYVDYLNEERYQEVCRDYDLINLGPAIISLNKVVHATLSYITFDDEFDCGEFEKFKEIIDEIGVLLCMVE